MARQLALFPGDAEAGPHGLAYRPEFVTAAEERALIEHIRALPLAPFQFGVYEGRRRVAYFGTRYDFTRQRLEQAEPLPEWIRPLAARIERWAGAPPGRIRHALFTEYDIGVGIGWHRDKPQFDLVFGISLGAACRLRFRRKSGSGWERFTLNAEPRSLYALIGETRHGWEHSIPPVEAQRCSVTFRTMVER